MTQLQRKKLAPTHLTNSLYIYLNVSVNCQVGIVSVSLTITMERFLMKLSMWFVILTLFEMSGYKGCMEEERIGLLELKSFLISGCDREYTNYILNSWVDDPISNCCRWEGVQCNAINNRVTELSLYMTRKINFDKYFDGVPILNLSLFLPFQELQILDLSDNYFEGWDVYEGIYFFFLFFFVQILTLCIDR